ncbi:MAG: Peptidase M16 domain protein [Candidatus Magasanikbacteria bacterium GW2011_GWC2_37_14]|uniref:Peptidase M16 domain protein n=1 Tax=Candidatus Magasanikbacteria bacterium GW2011_GWC2_37_14 TaxID=1619046 RepID=A0A0G0GCM4_9BACT|nr:MAG: Peptidase M16 domain protein [Candidatus Magasanikbacteria bacterium GW2011_GWC2_37_14]
MPFKKYELKNKTTVFLVPQPDAQSTTVLVLYPVGSRYENNKLAGVSHFIEHLMFKGTKKRPTSLALTREIDRLGAEYNAFTSKEYTGYYIKSDAKYLDISLDILCDMLNNSKFDAKEMAKEKKVIVEELRMYNDNPLINIENVFENLIFKDTDLGRNIGGSETSVLNLPRAEVLKYYHNFYAPENTYIAVAGAVGGNTVKLIEKYFGHVNPAKAGHVASHAKSLHSRVPSRNYSPAKFGPETKTARIAVEKKPTDQVQLMLGLPGLDHNDKRNEVLSVLNTILGGSMSSRLFSEIREKRGLAYMVRSGEMNYRDTGFFDVRMGLEAKNINGALQVVKKEMEKIIKSGVTVKELKDAKTHLHGALTLSMEDSSTQASWYLQQALFLNEIKTPAERLKEIDRVTNVQIKKLAKEIFVWNKVRVAIIGNVEKENIKF